MRYHLPVLNSVSRSITLSRPLTKPLLSSLRHRTSAPTSQAKFVSTAASDLEFGQPIHETHPHLLKAGERKLVILISLYAELLLRPSSKSHWASPPLNTLSVDQSSHQSSQGTRLRLYLLQTSNSDQTSSSTSSSKTQLSCTSPVLQWSSWRLPIC